MRKLGFLCFPFFLPFHKIHDVKYNTDEAHGAHCDGVGTACAYDRNYERDGYQQRKHHAYMSGDVFFLPGWE